MKKMSKKVKKQNGLTFGEKMLRHKKAGLSHKGQSNENINTGIKIQDLSERIKKILQIVEHTSLNAANMLFFVMYDIENNKVRTAISKYLEQNKCLRVQKSIFFSEAERSVFNKIHSDLKHIQELYDNKDSIFMVPVSTDQLRAMKVIGQNTDFDIIIGKNNTLFF